jgi:hypothetical protein
MYELKRDPARKREKRYRAIDWAPLSRGVHDPPASVVFFDPWRRSSSP